MMINRRAFLGLTVGGATAGSSLGLYAWKVEPHWLEVVRRRLPVARLPPSLVGRSIVQLSDIHVGPRVSDEYVRDAFDRVRALRPSIVTYTGDMVSYHDGILEHAERVYTEMPRGTLATVAILGNHEYGPGWSHPELARQFTGMFESLGVAVLRNSSVDVEGLQIVGIDDLWAGRFDAAAALANLDRVRPAVVLSHNPDSVDHPGWDEYEGWILAGHTHGGQCKLPFIPPPILPVVNKRYTSGEFDVGGGRRLYISRGVGHLHQVRFNVRPEITVFELTAAT
jgi:predicted MPP superfamily phosphohydrolase